MSKETPVQPAPVQSRVRTMRRSLAPWRTAAMLLVSVEVLIVLFGIWWEDKMCCRDVGLCE